MPAIVVTVELSGDVEALERAADACENMRPFLEKVGEFGMSQAQLRLSERMSPSADAVTGGHLMNSLTVGGPKSIFELADNQVEYGSNVRYAAQVNFGGIIEPATGKALAIPLTPQLKRDGLWPREFDRGVLRFQQYSGGKPNVFGLLIDDGEELKGRQRKVRGKTKYGPGPLFALAYWVRQEGKHFLELTDEDLEEITGPMWRDHLGL